MPLYTFYCPKCLVEDELLLSLREYENFSEKCEDCGEPLKRRMDAANFDCNPYQMKAVMSDGRHVAGHFGKSAKKK